MAGSSLGDWVRKGRPPGPTEGYHTMSMVANKRGVMVSFLSG